MTEQEWLETGILVVLLEHLRKNDKTIRRKAGQRRLHLFNCACLRRMWDRLDQPMLRETVELIERYVEGQADKAAVTAAGVAIAETLGTPPLYLRAAVRTAAFPAMLAFRARNVAWGVTMTAGDQGWRGEERAQTDLLREIFGNPFRPLAKRDFPAEVRSLARSCYDGEPGVYLILADALADLGEETAAAHCRQSGHVKGCHIVDWVLGKT
jgi:hypothetical protein